MVKRKRRPRRGAKKKPAPAPETEPSAAKVPRDWAEIGRAYGLMLFGAVMVFLGYAGFDLWPFAFVAWVPAMFVMDARPKGWVFFRRALFFGYLCYYGGFYWIVNTIVDFGGFPYALALLFASIYYLYQALQFVLVLWLYRRARDRGWNATLSIVVSFLAAEAIFPQLFDHFYGNAFHGLPYLVQVADLGGPMLLTAMSVLASGATYEVVSALVKKRPVPKIAPAVFASALALYLGYGAYRIADVEERMASADTIQVGVVQTNMGIFEKRDDPGEGLRRHLEQSQQLAAEGPLDLIVWPESAASFRIPRELGTEVTPRLDFALQAYRMENPGLPEVPIIFGGLSAERRDGRLHYFNTAFLTDREGRVAGHYDKTYLLAFGEYIPFGETFPQLYEASPNTGRFTPGDHVDSLPLQVGDREYALGALVCYEDIIPRFVRSAVNQGNPHLLVNVTNDAWFGETQEPFVHLALSKMRAVEHHRYLVRATNTGVSAIIDPLGRTVTQSGLFERASLRGEVHMLQGTTVYATVGDWPGWLALAALVYIAFIARHTPSSPTPSSPAPKPAPANPKKPRRATKPRTKPKKKRAREEEE